MAVVASPNAVMEESKEGSKSHSDQIISNREVQQKPFVNPTSISKVQPQSSRGPPQVDPKQNFA